MMIEIIPIGSNGDRFQIRDGDTFGLLEMYGQRAPWEDTRRGLQQWPEAMAVFAAWLDKEGVLVGSPHPPVIRWSEIVAQITKAG